MATVAALFSHLRRSRQFSSLSLLYLPRVLTSHRPTLPPPPQLPFPHSPSRAASFAFLGTHAFSTGFPGNREPEADSFRVDSAIDEELLKAIADSATAVAGGGGVGEEDDRIFPVRAVISMLDAFHDFSGFPWWITIASSTLALRIVLLCPLVLTLHKVKRIGEFYPK